MLLDYQGTGGQSRRAPQQWPAGTQITFDSNRATLLMFAHPQCPCTRASFGELNRLLARSHGKVAAQVWFFQPSKPAANWARTGLWESAAALPGVAVHQDLDGTQARLFGAETSGAVLLFDTHGHLLFQGGITGSRGHAGDNAGEDAVISLLDGEATKVQQTEVFGCSLLSDCQAPHNEAIK